MIDLGSAPLLKGVSGQETITQAKGVLHISLKANTERVELRRIAM
jgi:hypothetical protein